MYIKHWIEENTREVITLNSVNIIYLQILQNFEHFTHLNLDVWF